MQLTNPRPMTEFDPERPSRVHDRLNDEVFVWEPALHGPDWRYAKIDRNGIADFDGLMLDGWEPVNN